MTNADTPKVGPAREGASSRRLALTALIGLLAVLAVTAYYPFTFKPPRFVTNTAVHNADHTLSLGSANRARTEQTPAWLDDVRRNERVKVQLDVLPSVLQGETPIMMLATDYWHTDFAFVQQGADLELWLRRIGSTENGDPAWVVPQVFHPGRWADLRLAVDDDRLTVAVDGVARLEERLPAGSLQRWGPGRVALGSEVNGGGSWQGRLRTARVETSTRAVDYAQPGALETPDRFLEIGDHVAPFPPPDAAEWLVEFLHLVTFVPIGFLLVLALGTPPRVRVAITWAAGIALAMAAAKFLFPRHTSVADLVVQVTGASLGAVLAAWLMASRARRRIRHDVGPEGLRIPRGRDDHDGPGMRLGVAEGADISGVPAAGAGQWLGQTQGGTE